MFKRTPDWQAQGNPGSYLLAAACLVLCWTTSGRAFGAPQVDDRSLARITAYMGKHTEIGTGFLVEPDHIVTAYHVVQGARRIDVVLGGNSYRDVEVIAVRPEADLALLRAPEGRGVVFYRVAEGPTRAAGSSVYLHGLPLGFERQLLVGHLTQSGYLQSQMWADRSGQSLFTVRDLSLVPLDITSEPGVSGGPVLDEQGTVFGVFSGSLQAGGRGYSWAVPMYYARLDRMLPINKPASAIAQWPPFSYLRPGLSLLRSLHPDSEGARLARRCRERVDDYTESWEVQLDVANHYVMKWEMLKPTLHTVLAADAENLPAQKAKLGFAWESLQPQMLAFTEAQTRFEASTAQMVTSCYSHTMAKALIPEDLPATRENLLFDSSLTRRIEEIERSREMASETRKAIEESAQSKMEELFGLMQDFDTLSEGELLQTLKQSLLFLESSMSSFLSEEQAGYIAFLVRTARAWAEIIEAIELHPWEREYQTYSYQDPSGIALSLANGWLSFDGQVREAIVAPSAIMPDYVKFLRVGSLGKTVPQAAGEVYWQASHAPQSTALSQAAAYWNEVDAHWRALQEREGTPFVNTQRYENSVAGDLLLEMTGDGRVGATNIRVYVAHRFSAGGTASLVCLILSGELGYENCMDLTDTLRVPH